MEVLTFKNKAEASQKAFDLIKESLANGAEVFGLATGSTPETLYELISDSDLDFSQAISINLDEYYGLAGDHEQSYRYFMQENLFNAKPFKESYLPDGTNTNAAEETAQYDQILENHPIDLQILGIGTNGHIGFNEPGAAFDCQTQLVDLTQETIDANKRFFDSADEVPKQAYSMGIGSIMNAKQIILMAFGENKAQAIYDMVHGPVTPDLPASILQEHDNVTVLVDEEAGKLL